jgi:hypothetical protein
MEPPIFSSPNIIRLIISRRKMGVRLVASMREKSSALKGLEGKHEG